MADLEGSVLLHRASFFGKIMVKLRRSTHGL